MSRAALSREVAAAMTLTTELEPVAIFKRPTHANALVDVAKRLQRLQTRAATQTRALKRTRADIRLAQRELRALCAQIKGGA